MSRLIQDQQLGYGGVSRVGQGLEVSYGVGNRASGISSSDYLPSGNVVEREPYSSSLNWSATGAYRPSSGSSSYY